MEEKRTCKADEDKTIKDLLSAILSSQINLSFWGQLDEAIFGQFSSDYLTQLLKKERSCEQLIIGLHTVTIFIFINIFYF